MAILASNGKVRLVNGKAMAVTPAEIAPVLTTLVLNESHLDLTVYQRATANTAQVPVSGTFVGEAPTSIQARTVNDTTSVQSLAWTDITGLVVVGNTFAGFLTVPKSAREDMHRMQARAGSGQPVAAMANRFAVGIRMAFSGQSNMVGLPNGVSRYPSSARGCYEYREGANKRIGNISDGFPPNTLSTGPGGYGSNYTRDNGAKVGDGYVYIANQVAMLTDTPVCVYEQSSGGTPISGWTGTTPSAWNAFAAGLPAGHTDFEIFLWYQGESNAYNTTTAAMVVELGKLQEKVHTLTGRTAATLKFFIISLGSGSYNGSTEGQFGNMRAAHVQFANSTPGAYLATTAHDCVTSDGVHLVGSSHGINGARTGLSIAAALGVGKSGAGPRIAGASYANGFVDFDLVHAGGTAMRDGAGGNGAALIGFQFKDESGAMVTYGATSFPAPNRIRVAVNGVPATASFAMMNCPHNSTPTDSKTAVVLASIPCDDVTVLGSTYGCPLQPCAPINVTGS